MKRFQKVLQIIKRHERFLVSSHHNPDADALCSALAVALYLKTLGKKVHVLNEDACPAWLKFLPKSSLLKRAQDVKKFDYDAAIVLDCGDSKRLGGVNQFIRKDKPLVNIDHHVTNDRFGSVNIIDSEASSTCEMVYDLLQEARFKMTKDAATLLYAGIMTDTGSFRYENTSAYSHEVAYKLMSFGLSAEHMYDRLYVGIPVADLRRFTDVIHEAKLLYDNKVYCISLTKKVTESFANSFDLKEKLFAFLRAIDGIEVVVILTELSAKEVRVNLRSQSRFDVAALASRFDGGGHRKAAGCKIYQPLARARDIMCRAIHERL